MDNRNNRGFGPGPGRAGRDSGVRGLPGLRGAGISDPLTPPRDRAAAWMTRDGDESGEARLDAEMRAAAEGPCAAAGNLSGYPLAMVYAPDQEFDALYDGEEALARGTLFRELDLPFCRGCGR